MQNDERVLWDVINPLISLLYLGNQLIDLSLVVITVANVAIDNATIITTQISQVTFAMMSQNVASTTGVGWIQVKPIVASGAYIVQLIIIFKHASEKI